jgi:hypothetical protein
MVHSTAVLPASAHAHIRLNTDAIKRTNGRSVGPSKRSNVLSEMGERGIEKLLNLFFEFLK